MTGEIEGNESKSRSIVSAIFFSNRSRHEIFRHRKGIRNKNDQVGPLSFRAYGDFNETRNVHVIIFEDFEDFAPKLYVSSWSTRNEGRMTVFAVSTVHNKERRFPPLYL